MKTNRAIKYKIYPKPDTPVWIISRAMKVIRLLSDEEVNEILIKNNINPINRKGGNKALDELGL